MNNKRKKGTTLLNFHIFFFRFKYGFLWKNTFFLYEKHEKQKKRDNNKSFLIKVGKTHCNSNSNT